MGGSRLRRPGSPNPSDHTWLGPRAEGTPASSHARGVPWPLAPPRRCCAPTAMRPGLRESGDVPRLHVIDLEAALLEERRDVPRQVQAFEQRLMDGLPAALPATDSRLGR